jgi:fibronectin-binding autotransporter adhesin
MKTPSTDCNSLALAKPSTDSNPMNTPKTSRTRNSTRILAGSIAALLAAQSAFAQNTLNNYTGAPTGSLLLTGNWSLGASPLVTNDAVFPLGAGGGIRTLSAGDLTVGSFNVVANSNTFSIRNDTSTSTNSNLTLGGVGNLGNSVGGAGDLLYAASGSTFNIIGANGGGGSGLLNLILGQSGNFNLAGTAASTISTGISDGGSGYALTKAGGGTLTFNGTAAHTFTGGLAVRGGTLALDFATLVTPMDLIASGNALTFGSGGAMTLKAKGSGATTAQTFNGVTVNAGGGSLLVDPLSVAETTNLTLGSLGTLSSWVKGSSLVLGKANTNAGTLAITTTTDYDAQSIYGGRIVLASGSSGAALSHDWATRDSSVGAGPFTLAAFGAGGNFGSYTEMVNAAATDALNTRMTADRSLSGNHTHNSLKIESGRTLALNANQLELTSGGLLSTGTAESTISGTAGATRLTAGADSGYDLIVHQYNNSTNGLTISAQIGDNGGNAVSLTKAGTGNVQLSGNNTFTGGVNWNAGKLLLGHDTALGAGGTFTINGGSIGATANRIIANSVSINGDFTYTKQSSSANLLFTGAVDLGSAPRGARTINISGANSDQHYSFTIRGVISNGPAGGGNALIKAGNGHLFLTGHNTYTGGTTVTGGDEWSALYIGHNNALGAGALSLNGGAIMAYGEAPRTIANNVLWGGSFNFGGTNVTFQDLTITGTTNTGTIARTVTIASNAKTTLGAVTYAGDHTFSFSNATAKSLEMTGDVTLTGGNRTFTVSSAATLGNALVISGAVKEDVAGRGLTKLGTGVLVLSGNSNYSGTTTITTGPLRATSGTGLPITSHISLGGGVLELTGDLTARTLTTTAGTNTLQWGTGGVAAFGGTRNVNFSSGAQLTWGTTNGFVSGIMILGSSTATANLDFQNPIDLNNAARTMQVDDNTTTSGDSATFSGVISSATPASGALTKTGTSTLVLSGTNTYAGATTITTGALRANSDAGLPGAGNPNGGSFLRLDGGVLESSGATSFTRANSTTAGGGNFNWVSANGGGFSANGGKLTVTINNNAATTQSFGAAAANDTVFGTLKFGSTTANAETEFQNNINLNDAVRTVQVDDNAYNGGDYATISGVISSTTPASGALTKTGTGTLALSGTNTYAGNTTISAGALRAAEGTGLPSGSYLRLDGGVLEGSGVTTFTRVNSTTVAGTNFNWATTNGGGFSANGGKMTVNIGGAATTQTWGAAAGNDTIFGTLKFGSAIANAETDFTNPINLNNGARTFSVEDNPHSTADFARISALINSSPAGGGITKSGTGLLVIDNASYTGATTINGGVLRMSLANLAGAGLLTISGGGILETSGVFTRQLTSAAGATNLNLAGNGGFSAFGGTLEINLRGQVTPVLVPWNDNFGGAGQRTADSVNGNDCRRMYSNNAVMVLNSIYSDSMVNWRNPLALGWNSGLSADTAGVRYSAGKIRDIQVNDNPLLNTDFARLSGEISDGAAPASNNGIRKSGTGLLELTAANSYTGATFIDAGTIAAVHATALGTAASGTIVANGATLEVRADIGTEAITVGGTGVGGLNVVLGALIVGNTFAGTVGGPVTLTGNTSIGAGFGPAGTTATLDINGTVAAGANTLTTLGTGVTTFGTVAMGSDLTALASLAVTDGTTNVNSPLGTAGNAVVAVSDTAGGVATKLRFGSVSQTLSSLTIGAGATVVFTSGLATGALTGDDGGGKAAGFGSPASSFGGGATVPEPGTLGLLLVGALGMLNRRRRQA